ncbi:hypothetical protein ABE28_023965 (plasmid) [Peribacillus muralis]|uniref:Uncharacterized protein n=1 Tax=Peribacillus muralis TaxID=264697 RepID=A0A1B3XW03_9BACI|nr:hypothetical protein [Peribacillus muralis]AOH57408.1 hypothetical protein ABE28_023965 [Peribacillus muralis]
MKNSLIISKLILQTWKKEFSKLIDNFPKLLILSLFLLTISGTGALISYQITSDLVQVFLTNSIETTLPIALTINMSLMSFVLFIIFKLLTQDDDMYSTMFAWLPVNTFEKNLGFFLPYVIVVSIIINFLLTLLFLPSLYVNNFGIGNILLTYLVVNLQVILILSLANIIYNTLFYLTNKLKIPFNKNLTIILMITMVFYYYTINFIDVEAYLTEEFKIDLFSLMTTIYAATTNSVSNVLNLLFLSLIVFGAIINLNFLSFYMVSTNIEKQYIKPIQFTKFKDNIFFNLIKKEILCQTRDVNNILNLITSLSIIFLVKIYFGNGYNEMILLGSSTIVGLVAFSSYANSKSYLPLYKIYNLSNFRVHSAKLLGLIQLAILQFVFISIITFTFVEDWLVYLYSLGMIIGSILMFFILGTLFPVSKNSVLTNVLTIVVLVIVALPLFIIVNYVSSLISPTWNILFILCIGLIMIMLSSIIFKWRLNNEYK